MWTWFYSHTSTRVRLRRQRIDRRIRVVRRGVLKGSAAQYAQQRARAETVVRERVRHLNQAYGFAYRRVTIKNLASRWGSCSTLGNLNFHYKVALLPEALRDYILVHELCHVQELNHSKRFWALVAKTIPHHRVLQKRLKEYATLRQE